MTGKNAKFLSALKKSILCRPIKYWATLLEYFFALFKPIKSESSNCSEKYTTYSGGSGGTGLLLAACS